MLYIDENTRTVSIRYYYGNIHSYNEAMRRSNKGKSSIILLQLAESAIDMKNHKVLKCRYPLTEMFDEYYQARYLEARAINA